MGYIYGFCGIVLAIIVLFFLAKKFELWRKIYIVVTVLLIAFYIIWRLLFTLNFSSVASGISSIALFAAELLGVSVTVFFMALFCRRLPDAAPPEWKDGFAPSVDILICTYNEPIGLVSSSAVAAASLPYLNKKVYICDDGHREMMKQIAHKMGVEYITRDNNEHAKAGNINYALSQTSGDLVLLLDADFIVKPYLLSEGIPYFQDEQIAMVQFPQTFYNKDAFQIHNEKLFNEQDFFMRYIEPELAERNAMVHIGTNALIRRSALEKIGGIPTMSITEDMATGMLLQNAGFRNVFVGKSYALGVAPFTLKDLKSQRKRWAKGTMQIFKRLHPLRLKGLNFIQKLLYSQLFLYWMTSFQKLIYIIAPTVFMIFGIPIVNITVEQFLLIVVPILLLFSMNFRVLTGNVRTYFSSHVYDTVMAPFHAGAILQELFRSESKFHVTPKDSASVKNWNFGPVVPHIVIAGWLIFALVMTGLKVVGGVSVLPLLVCAGWSIYNLYALIYSISLARPAQTETIGEALSVDIDEKMVFEGESFHAYSMSFSGLLLQKNDPVQHRFKEDEPYLFQIPSMNAEAKIAFVREDASTLEFRFVSVDRRDSYRLSNFYVEKLHAAHAIEQAEQDRLHQK